MKLSIACSAVALLILGTALSAQRRTDNGCDFTLSGTRAKPDITGPQEVVAMTHVVDQPDSPVEIVAADFKNSFVSIANERFTEQLDCSIKLRNRSDHVVRSFRTIAGVTPDSLGVAALSGFGASPNLPKGRSLIPGEELEIQGCGSRGDGGAPNNRVRLIVGIDTVSLDGCLYVPSRRFAY